MEQGVQKLRAAKARASDPGVAAARLSAERAAPALDRNLVVVSRRAACVFRAARRLSLLTAGDRLIHHSERPIRRRLAVVTQRQKNSSRQIRNAVVIPPKSDHVVREPYTILASWALRPKSASGSHAGIRPNS